LRNNDGLNRRGGPRIFDLGSHRGLAVKPGLRDENGEQAENHRKANHDKSACAHALIPVCRRPILLVVAATIAGASIELVKAAALSLLSSTGFKPAFFTDRFLKCLQLNQFLTAPAATRLPLAAFVPKTKVFRIDRLKF
jgi:hypothetical protein